MINNKIICKNCNKEFIDTYKDLNNYNKKVYCDDCVRLFFKLYKDDEYKAYQVEQALIKIQEHKARLRKAIQDLDEEARSILKDG